MRVTLTQLHGLEAAPRGGLEQFLQHRIGCRRGAQSEPHHLAVIINDSHGRAWRIGTTGVCIGCAGLPPVWNQRGLHDLFGYELVASEECIADELAGAASLMMGQSNEGRPVIVILGYQLPPAPPATAQTIQRPAEFDAFR